MAITFARRAVLAFLTVALIFAVSGCKKSKSFEGMSFELPDGWVAVEKQVNKQKIMKIGVKDPDDPSQPQSNNTIQLAIKKEEPKTTEKKNKYYSNSFKREVEQVFQDMYVRNRDGVVGNEKVTYFNKTTGLYTIDPFTTEVISKAVTESSVIYFPKSKLSIEVPKSFDDSMGLQNFIQSISF